MAEYIAKLNDSKNTSSYTATAKDTLAIITEHMSCRSVDL